MVSHSFHLAEDHGGSILLREAAQLLVESRQEVAHGVASSCSGFGDVGHRGFSNSPFGPHRPRLDGRPIRDAVEPVADHRPRRHRPRFPGEDEECRLEGVFGVVVVPEDPEANAPDHRAMSLDEDFQSRLISTVGKTIEEILIRKPSDRTKFEERHKVSVNGVHDALLRQIGPVYALLASLIPVRARSHTLFFRPLEDSPRRRGLERNDGRSARVALFSGCRRRTLEVRIADCRIANRK